MKARKNNGGEARADLEALRESFGPASANLRTVARLWGLAIGPRGHELIFKEADGGRERAARRVLAALGRLAAEGARPGEWEAECLVNLVLRHPEAELDDYLKPLLAIPNRRVTARTETQRRYVEAMSEHDLVFGLGPAGTGKTYLAVAAAVANLAEEKVSRIIITRPAVEAGEKLGFLPGDLAEKINPYLRPIHDALDDLLSYEKYLKLAERRIIEVAPLAFMRGRTLTGAFVILDEAQNATREQMKMFLTRLGPGARAVVTGDPSQSDLPGGEAAGLNEAAGLLEDIEGVAVCRFTSADVIRHRLVRSIIEAYDRRART
ncbi:MAG: PhoH family protein [Candidatus Adiutrix sp.]|nr:PhoH family protein [Candidatus Adiutrix sp.]